MYRREVRELDILTVLKARQRKAQHLLFTSIESNYFELLKQLLELGVDTDIKNEVGVAICCAG